MCKELPKQEAGKATCGACATAYYIYFASNKTNKEILGKIGEIYGKVQIDGLDGSHPVKIKNYLREVNENVKLYVPDEVNPEFRKLMGQFINDDTDEIEPYYKVIIGSGNGYAITLWCPVGWKMGQPLSNMHYMLTKVDSATGKLLVIDSNFPNDNGNPYWQTVGNPNNFTPDGCDINFFFTGLIITSSK